MANVSARQQIEREVYELLGLDPGSVVKAAEGIADAGVELYDKNKKKPATPPGPKGGSPGPTPHGGGGSGFGAFMTKRVGPLPVWGWGAIGVGAAVGLTLALRK